MTHDIVRQAELSLDGLHRLWLQRDFIDVDHSVGIRRVTWVMCNPSTADGDVDDATIRRCYGFLDRWGATSMQVVNLWTYIATDVADLPADPAARNHARADAQIREAELWADVVIAGWGAVAARVPGWEARVAEVIALLEQPSKLKSLGTTSAGHPRHPLMLPYRAQLAPWPPT